MTSQLYRRVASAALAACLVLPAAAAANPNYRLEKKVQLGGEGGWDYFAVDPDSGHVFIPRDSHMLVLDSHGNLLGDIPGIKGAHAIAFAPGKHRAYLSSDGSVTEFDTAQRKVVKVIPLPGDRDPDAILYDAASGRVFTFNGGGTKDATAIDAASGKIAGSVPLGGKPEFAQAAGDGTVYVNIEDKSQLLAFDARSLQVLHVWPLAPCERPSGLAIDTAHKRLFSGCRNQVMTVFDYSAGKVIASVPIGKGVDAANFDPSTGLAFASCGDGTITVAGETSPGTFAVVQTIRTQQSARTMTLDPKTHNVYTVAAQFGPPPKPTKEHPHPWPSMIPGTFTLLIYTR